MSDTSSIAGTFSDGILEIQNVTRIFEEAGICCCLSGISALIFHGAGRVRGVSNLLKINSYI